MQTISSRRVPNHSCKPLATSCSQPLKAALSPNAQLWLHVQSPSRRILVAQHTDEKIIMMKVTASL